jgi:hypothetical protein
MPPRFSLSASTRRMGQTGRRFPLAFPLPARSGLRTWLAGAGDASAGKVHPVLSLAWRRTRRTMVSTYEPAAPVSTPLWIEPRPLSSVSV